MKKLALVLSLAMLLGVIAANIQDKSSPQLQKAMDKSSPQLQKAIDKSSPQLQKATDKSSPEIK